MSATWPEVLSADKENRHELVLSGPQITERIQKSGLDESIYRLGALNYLNISETSLESISDKLSNLSNLQTLVLHSNKLTAIPNTIIKLQKLKNLDISRNLLESLPDEISGLEQLVALNASSNQLTTIPNLGKNTKLAILDLANNKLSEFPDVCYPELIHLAEIKVNKNLIELIPGNIRQLASLKNFDIGENLVKNVPYEIFECAKLKGNYIFCFYDPSSQQLMNNNHLSRKL